jgi:16S rRNA (guanine527-N7)-methyltransferase
LTAIDLSSSAAAQAATEALRGPLTEAAQQLRLQVSHQQADTLLAFLGLLRRWNATYNLTSVRDPAAMLTQHLADCLAVVEPVRRHLNETRPYRLLDVGSGGGLPGVVIAVMCPNIHVVCVDAVGKKAAFVRQASSELRLNNLQGEHARAERLTLPAFDLITSRAFASLDDFVKLTRQQLTPGGCWMAMKGKSPDAEVAALPADVVVFHVEHLVVPGLDAERCLVWIRPELAAVGAT